MTTRVNGRVRQQGNATDAVSIFLFAGLCWINCTAIEAWEAGRSQAHVPVAAGLAGICAGVLVLANGSFIGAAELFSASALLFLHRVRTRLSTTALRVLADVALLSPLLFLPFS